MMTMDELINAVVPNQAQLLGGANGRSRLISNIHTVEDPESAKFIKNRELIFLTGVAINDTLSLENLIHCFAQKNIAGIVISTGYYIKTIPQSIIEFCNNQSIPLLSLPWKYSLSDFQKPIFKNLLTQQYHDEFSSNIVEQILHRIYSFQNEFPAYLDLKTDERFCAAIMDIPESEKANLQRLQHHLSSLPCAVCVIQEQQISHRIAIIFRQQADQNTAIHESNLKKWLNPSLISTYKIGIGQPCESWKKLADSYEEAALSINIASSLSYTPPFIIFFQNIALMQIIQHVPDKDVLTCFVTQILGKLKDYDAKNHSDLMQFLYIWLKYSGKTQKIADELFIHRNTVNYRINKIKMILGYDELTYPRISNLMIALLIDRKLSTIHPSI